jgi:hypothetical protein
MNPEIYEINMQKAVDKERRLRFELERLIIQTLIEDSMTVTRNGERVDLNDALKKARGAINGLLDIASEENLDSEQAGRAYAALHEIGTALAALDALGFEIREKG